MRKIKEYRYVHSEINAIYYGYLGEYLEKTITENDKQRDEFGTLFEHYNHINSIINEISAYRAKKHSSTGIPPAGNPPEIEDMYETLRKVVEDFIINFKKAHKL